MKGNSIIILVMAIVLVSALYFMNLEFIGFQTYNTQKCASNGPLLFSEFDSILLDSSNRYTSKIIVSCVDEDIIFHDNSDIISIDEFGIVRLVNTDPNEVSNVPVIFIIEDSKGNFESKKINVIVE